MLPKRSTVYSADAINFQIATLAIASGKGKDTFLEIEEEEDQWEYVQGLDGEGMFCLKQGGATRLKLTLLATSAGNGVISALHSASVLAGGLTYPFYYEDAKGTSKLAAGSGVIVKLPPQKFGATPGDVVWEFIVHAAARFVGGH